MTQAIDPVKLKSAAEHLEWVLKQYPDESVVQGMLNGLRPLIDAAKAGDVTSPVERIPFGYAFSDGAFWAYKQPNVEEAYVAFEIEISGGLDEQEKRQLEEMEAYRKTLQEGKP